MTAIYSSIDSVEEMTDRRERCQLTLIEILAQRSEHHPASPKFWDEIERFRFLCIPKLETLDRVYHVENHAAWLKNTFGCLGITLFKIPRHVNDVEGYVTMLLREHF